MSSRAFKSMQSTLAMEQSFQNNEDRLCDNCSYKILDLFIPALKYLETK